ncbi:MAG: hypothetical protein V4699_02305 [Patescibacteria group bacterium]
MQKDEKIYPVNTGGAQNKIVETYAEDMAKVIENDQSGLIKKIIHSEEEHEKEKRDMSPESKKNRFFMFTSLVFILISLATLIFFFLKKENNTVPIEQQFTPIIFNDQSTFLEVAGLKKEEIAQTVLNAIDATSLKSGSVVGIYLTEDKKIVGLRRFLSLVKSALVLNENTLFISDNFLLGAVNGPTKDFFMILRVRGVSDIFDSLRIWENKMFSDLHAFFGVGVTAETKYLLTADFEDGVVENKNARILHDKDGKIVMMYVFADENSVIITNTESAAHEVVLRLAASRVKK